MEKTPLELIVDERVPAGLGGRWYGVYPATVAEVKGDPAGIGQVKLTLPWSPDPNGERYEAWARIATLMGGNGRGSWFIPDKGDEVLVAFEGGDPRRPYVLGGLWNGKDKPPASMDADGKNVKRLTNTPGYDGGAFFNADCSKIVWRASRPKPGKELDDFKRLLSMSPLLVRPSKLELYVANADGSDAQQITYLDAASFAPLSTAIRLTVVVPDCVNDPPAYVRAFSPLPYRSMANTKPLANPWPRAWYWLLPKTGFSTRARMRLAATPVGRAWVNAPPKMR